MHYLNTESKSVLTTTENTGGGCMVDFIHLDKLISLDDESIQVSDSYHQWSFEPEKSHTLFFSESFDWKVGNINLKFDDQSGRIEISHNDQSVYIGHFKAETL